MKVLIGICVVAALCVAFFAIVVPLWMTLVVLLSSPPAVYMFRRRQLEDLEADHLQHFSKWKGITCTSDIDPILLESATVQAKMIKDGTISSSALVELHIKQIERVNPLLNAVIGTRFSDARLEAQQADVQLRDGSRNIGPFHGVPCSIKEAFALKGMTNSSGHLKKKEVLATQDATAVSRLRKAGFIPLGVTNTSELCMWMESSNRCWGRTNNPYDPNRIVGGSSGGEACIVSACGAPIGLGSDIGGSIRMPSFFCGVFGHKPTGGMVPNSGQFPIAENEGLKYLTTGPICRRAEDLYPLLKILAGPDGIDSGCVPWQLGDPSTVNMSDLRLYSIEGNSAGIMPLSMDLQVAQQKVCEGFQQRHGVDVQKLQIKELKKGLDIWSAMLGSTGGKTFAELLKDGEDKSMVLELIKWSFGLSTHTLPAVGLALIEPITTLFPNKTKQLVQEGKDLKMKISDILGENGLIIFPSYTDPAPKHSAPILPPINYVYTCVWNILEFPCTQVPLGLNSRGLPLGVQIIGPHGKDHLTIAAALEVEKMFGGWAPRT